jgi:hypothetical protein
MTDEPKLYYCPTTDEVEQHPGGGFDVCCDHPELHRAIKWTDLFGIDPDYLKDADEGCTGEGRGRGYAYTASEVKVLTETATKLGRELGRREVWEQVADEISLGEDWQVEDPRISYVDVQIDKDAYLFLAEIRASRSIPSRDPGATSDATSGVPGHPEVSEAVRSPQEPCEDPECWWCRPARVDTP